MIPGSSALLLTDDGYNIQRSLRFRSSASAYLSRTPASAGNRKTWTWSGWVKRGTLGIFNNIFLAQSGSTYTYLGFNTSNQLEFGSATSGTTNSTESSVAVYRDISAWYHIELAIDTTQATASNRIKIFVNGLQISTTVSVQIAQNTDTHINSTIFHSIGSNSTPANFLDGYLAEVNFIDGQALTPSSFGETDAITGVWKPKKYAGTYGTNGFYLDFKDNTSATTLAYDKSGNSNNWTPNNISTTAGATYDSMTDVPTLTSATAANFAVLNPISPTNPATTYISNGNLRLDQTGTGIGAGAKSTIGGFGSLKFYFEVTVGTIGTGTTIFHVGVGDTSAKTDFTGGNFCYYNKNGTINGGSFASYTTGDVIAAAVDCGAGTIAWYKNNVLQTTNTGATYDFFFPMFMVSEAGSSYGTLNCGQRPFSYTPPTGFVALNTFNLPDPTIKKPNQYMDATTYSGNGTTQTITNAAGFQPDLFWGKSRSSAGNNVFYDSVRGVQKYIISNSTGAEGTASGVTSFNSNGVTVGSDADSNASGSTFVGWQWKKGATPGFDIVTYTGTGSTQSISHSLGVAPKTMIIKQRTSASTTNWIVWHTNTAGYSWFLKLNLADAQNGDTTVFPSAASSTTFSVGSNSAVNANSGTYVAYLFAEIPGFSKFGSYTGNGSADGPFVYCGFRPKWIMVKCSNVATDWYMWDSARDTYNLVQNMLRPNLSAAELNSSTYVFDFTSNGFKVRNTGVEINTNGNTYVFACFSENPFKYSLAR